MAKKAVSVFSETEKPKEPLVIKIDAGLKERMDEIQTRLKDTAPDRKFDWAGIVERTIREAVVKAEAELGKMKA